MQEISISVAALAEEWGRRGDLNRLAGSFGSALDGTRAHQRIQKSRPAGYLKEVPVEIILEREDLRLKVAGRVDGVFPALDPVRIEEIKTTYYELEEFAEREKSVHWAQASIYAYLYAREHNLAKVEIQVTCASLLTRKTLEDSRILEFGELEAAFLVLAEAFISWQRKLIGWRSTRNASLAESPFPFPEYRAGQRDLAVAAWKTITGNRQLLVQSPTGTGKTAATLYPAVKVFASGGINKVIYLTARTTGQQVAEGCLRLIRRKGARIKSVTLSAREKMCRGGGVCTGEECEFARGYYDRLGEAREAFFREDEFTRARIEELSGEHDLCPYAFSRELLRWSDCVICDFNYVFDPVVSAGLTSGEIEESAIIVDEAHNLADRARDNFSAELRRSILLSLSGLLKRKRRFHNLRKKAEESFLVNFRPEENPQGLDPQLLLSVRDLVLEIEKILLREGSLERKVRETLFEAWCELSHFLETAACPGPEYQLLYQPEGEKEISPVSSIKLFCMDPSRQLGKILDCCHSAIFLSGTLQPMEYYRQLNGCHGDAAFLNLPSPYPSGNLCTMIYPSLSTRYLDRERSLDDLVEVLADFISSRKGNYLVFFPSYAYLEMAASRMESAGIRALLPEELEICRQLPGMKDGDRAEFLARFSIDNPSTLVGMAVMGGVFGEGIDLVGDRLTGVAVIGVGLPSISEERDCIRRYFEERGEDGFAYSYLVPGMTRVLQAAGRVIRSETDRGVILLIDDRFRSRSYRALFPSYWKPVSAGNRAGLRRILEKFWK